VIWSLWELRAAVIAAQYLDDSSVHEQMVRFAAARIAAGHDPLTSWFPYLGMGSPQFLHYQSVPAIVTGLAGLVVGPDTAFRWSLYLLWCLWPVAIYASARVFGLGRWAAAGAAVAAPLLHSVPGIGYEQHAYVWAGFGVWTQLWGSWALPFAWALSWRALADRRFIAPAAGLMALTAAFHFESGYLAFAAIPVMAVLIRRGLRARLVRAAALVAVALLACAWVVVPLLLYARWSGINQALAGTPLVNGYGARQSFGWLVTGGVFDAGHLPLVTVLAAAGVVASLVGWRRPGPGRALVALLCLGLLLSFGRTTFGGLVTFMPGSADIFFRRFLMGAQLAGIYLAGLGAVEVVRHGAWLAGCCSRLLARRGLAGLGWVPAGALAVAGVVCVYPVVRYLDSYDAANTEVVQAQHDAQAGQWQASALAAMAAVIHRHGDGRAYAGSLDNWGQNFRAGLVPMYAYLESLDIDEVGYTLRTASLMTQPEAHFDAGNPGDYTLFGIRYLILPTQQAAPSPPPGAVLLLRNQLLRVYELPGNSYLRVADTVAVLAANRADVGSQSASYLRSALPGDGKYLTVAYAGAPPAPPTLRPATRAAGVPGTVIAEHTDLAAGAASAVVRLRRRAVVVLAASFDPGWSVTIDGRPAAAEMVAPALTGVTVPSGTHHIRFRYTGFGGYPELLVLAAAALVATAALTRNRRRSATPGQPPEPPLPTTGDTWPLRPAMRHRLRTRPRKEHSIQRSSPDRAGHRG
jgi:hypothetical protein